MLEKLIIQRTLRVPASTGEAGDGTPVARQLDAALLDVGFAASRDLLEHVGALATGPATDLAATVVAAVRELVGDHVRHNAYFIDFPENVPDTVEFWVERLRLAVASGQNVTYNLLDLPGYGRYQHTYADLLAAHDDLVAGAGDRLTVLRLGDTAEAEATRLYLAMAGGTAPLGEADLAALSELALMCVDGEQPAEIPVRENRAVLNGIRLVLGHPLVAVDTTTDVLRLACQVSGGDVSLATATRFRAFRRRERRIMLSALDGVVAANQSKLADVVRYAELWKRLGERLHPHEYAQWPHARDVFAVARGERKVRTIAGQAEAAVSAGAAGAAATVLSVAPGRLLRSADWLLRLASTSDLSTVVDAVTGALGSASGRVLCSLREHVDNRLVPASSRMFVTRTRRAWVQRDTRPTLPADLVAELRARLDAEIAGRLPVFERPVMVDPDVLDVALPLSGKASESGFAVLPRGSRATVTGDLLRFFMYWRQTGQRTDYDLSLLLLDDRFHTSGQVSWTNYRHGGVVHSGDVTDATNGATEFIDVPLDLPGHYVVPQVYVYAGESFDQVAESMFGYQTRDRDQQGRRSTPGPYGRVRGCAARAGWRCLWCSSRASAAGRRCGCTSTCRAGRCSTRWRPTPSPRRTGCVRWWSGATSPCPTWSTYGVRATTSRPGTGRRPTSRSRTSVCTRPTACPTGPKCTHWTGWASCSRSRFVRKPRPAGHPAGREPVSCRRP
ncbi:TerD family protein [Kibdelosporangium lantanae]